MDNARELLLKTLNDDLIQQIFSEYGIEEVDDSEKISAFLNHKSDIFDKFFSFLKPYVNDSAFWNSFNYKDDDVFERLLFTKFFVPDDTFFIIVNAIMKQRDDKLSLVLTDVYDIDRYLELGFSLKDIASFHSLSKEANLELYNRDHSLAKLLVDGYSIGVGAIVASEYMLGNKKLLRTFLSGSNGDENFLELLNELSNYTLNVRDFVNDLNLYTNYSVVDEDSSKVRSYSIVSDENLLRNLIANFGPEAIVFAKNITDELASLVPDLNYDSYLFYDGSIKKSPDILLNLLNRGIIDALYNCSYRAIDNRVIDFIKNNNISLDSIANSGELNRSYLICQLLLDNNYSFSVHDIDDVLKNVSAFDFVYNYILNHIEIDSFLGFEARFIKHFILNYGSKFIDQLNVSLEVGSRLVSLGLNFDKYFNKYSSIKGLDEALYNSGDKRVIYVSNNYDFINNHINEVTFEELVSLGSSYDVIGRINEYVLAKLYKEGHIEVIDYMSDDDLLYIDLNMFGLDKITYDDYLKLPERLKNCQRLKQKFIPDNSEELLEMLDINPTAEIVYKALETGIDHRIVFSKLRYDVLDFKCTKYFLENGIIDAIYFYSHYNSHSKEDDMELVELFYEKSGGLIPDMLRIHGLTESFIKYYLSKKNFDILDKVFDYRYIKVESFLDVGYDLEIFKAHPVLDGRLIEKIINVDNQDEVMEIILNNNNNVFSFFEKFILYIIKSDIDDSYIYKLTEKYSYNIEHLLVNSPISSKDLLSLINRKSLYNHKKFIDIIINNLTPLQIKSDLVTYSVSVDLYDYLISKMIELGYYDFVSLYKNRVDTKSLKEAIINGYFPSSLLNSRDDYIRIIFGFKFSSQEIEKFKEMLDEKPYYALLIPEIKNNPELLISYLSKCPEYFKLLDNNYIRNPEVLVALVEYDPELVSIFVNKNTDINTLSLLIRVSPKFLNYLPNYLITSDLIALTSTFAPQIIDYDNSVSDVCIINALKNGYVFNEKTSTNTISVAFRNGIVVPKEFIKNNISKFFEIFSLVDFYNSFEPKSFYDMFKPYFDFIKNNNEAEFYFEASRSFHFTYSTIPETFRLLFEEYGINELNEYYNYSQNKDTFYLYYFIKKNNIGEEDIDLLEHIIDGSTNKKQLLDMICNFYYNSRIVYDFIRRMALKHFSTDHNLIKYVDADDPKVVEICKGLIDEWPEVYKYVKKVLDNKKLILKLISLKYDVYSYLNDEFKCDLEILERSLELNQDNISFVVSDNQVVKDFLIKNMDKYPYVFIKFPEVLDSEEIIIKLMSVKKGCVYDYISDEFKRNFNICLAYVRTNENALFFIPFDVEGYDLIVAEGIKSFPYLFTYERFQPFITQELYEFVATKLDSAFIYLPIELQTVDNFKLMGNKDSFDYSKLDFDFVLKLIDYDAIHFVDENKVISFVSLLLSHGEEFASKISPGSIDLLKKAIKYISENANLFKMYLSLGETFNYGILGEDINTVFKNARIIIASTGKINTSQKNPVFSYDVCKYIFPLFGVEFTKNIIKYNTNAAKVLVEEIKNGNDELVVKYYKFLLEKNVLENDDKLVHFAFRDFQSFKILIIDVLNHANDLDREDIINLSKIIRNNNFYKIGSFTDLKNYTSITRTKTEAIIHEDNIDNVKNYISQLFGYSFTELKDVYQNFQLGNFSKIAFVKNRIKSKLSDEEFKKFWNLVHYTKYDLKLILLLERVLYSNNINEIKEIMTIHLRDFEKDIDYSLDLQNIIDKVRMLYNMEFNVDLTKVEDIKSQRLDKNDPSNSYGVTIIDMDSEKFSFLAHRLYTYDNSNSGFAKMLMDDPSLWFKLEGASTLSTSCFSDKGFWFLQSSNNNGVVYLFDTLPDKAMLFMYGRDLYVEHGGYRLEPTSRDNSYSDVQALIQSSHYHRGSYNEVALFREGVVPCAIACVGSEPTEDQIRAAKFFSEHTGKDIPIIRFNIPAYDRKKQEDLEKNKEAYRSTLDIELIEAIIFNGTDHSSNDISESVKFCFEIAKEAYQSGRISYTDFYGYMSRIIRTVNRLDNKVEDVQKEIARITLYRQSLIALTRLDRKTICRLNNAEMGESGLMYRMDEDDKSYLVKPAVEKGTFKRQDFRAEIQVASSRLQDLITPETAVHVDVIKNNSIALSKQELVSVDKVKTKSFEDWVNYGGELDDNIKNGLLKEYVLDFLLCNFDCFYGNFVIDSNGNLRGIDKEQSFRFMNDSRSLNPDFSFIPNGNGRVPIYSLLFDRYKKGEISLDFSVVTDTIEKARKIDDEQYKKLFESYASSLDRYKANEILDQILSRKNIALERIEEFIKELKNSRGVKL